MTKNPVAKNMNRFNRSQTIGDKRYKNYIKQLDKTAREVQERAVEDDKAIQENIERYNENIKKT